ncbi:MAG TPA: HAD hydrolase family protein [Bdellovibrionota bacterium]|nr:HAD hydrolase family protein [Bdellovibrionota bacterium]
MKNTLKKLKLLIFDCDGVMTDGKLIMGPDGYEQIEFFVLDGAGIHLANYAGYKVAVISGRSSKIILERAKFLDIHDVYINQFYKLNAYQDLKKKYGFKDEEIMYMGDDVLDIPVLKVAGFSVTVPHAVKEVKAVADYVTKLPGGGGAVREIIDVILQETGKRKSLLETIFEKGRG